MRGRRFLLCAPDATGNADGGAAAAAAAASAAASGDDASADAAAAAGTSAVTFTPEQQAHIDALVADRVERARKTTQKQTKEELEAEAKKAAMSAEEKLKAENEDLKKTNAATVQTANERILRSEAKLQLTAKGYTPEQAAILMRAIDLSGVDFDDKGEPDATAITSAIDAVAKVMPPAAPAAGTQRSGPDFKGGDQNKRVYTMAEIKAMTPEDYAAAEKDIDAAMAEPGHPRIKD